MEFQLSYKQIKGYLKKKILQDDAIKLLHSICQQIWEIQQRAQNWKRSILTPIPKKGSTKECSSHQTIVHQTIGVLYNWIQLEYSYSNTSKNMLKILQTRLQHYVNNFQIFKLGLEKAEEPEIKLLTFAGS